jgi:hypothetical protein
MLMEIYTRSGPRKILASTCALRIHGASLVALCGSQSTSSKRSVHFGVKAQAELAGSTHHEQTQ